MDKYEIYVPVHLISPRHYDKPTWKLVARCNTEEEAKLAAIFAAELNDAPLETIWIREPGEEVGFDD
jgi:hypothetical protein